jgi:hypothetical protein
MPAPVEDLATCANQRSRHATTYMISGINKPKYPDCGLGHLFHAVFLSSLLTQYFWNMLESILGFIFPGNPT